MVALKYPKLRQRNNRNSLENNVYSTWISVFRGKFHGKWTGKALGETVASRSVNGENSSRR